MMIEVMGMDMYEDEFEAVMAEAEREWLEEMDDWDRSCYESFEDFKEGFLHDHLYGED